MGFGADGDYADTVTDEFVKGICPEEHKTFMENVVELSSIDDVAYGLDELNGVDDISDVDAEEEDKIREPLDALIKAFKEKTGVDLVIRYIESEGRNSDVDGFFWGVDNIYQLTPAAEKIKDKIARKHWITYG